MNTITPVVRGILIACVAVFLLQRFTAMPMMGFALWPLGSDGYGSGFEVWQIVTYAFLHDPNSYLHIIFNMYALYMFGSEIERLVGPKRFAVYYLVCVITAALTQLTVQHMTGDTFNPTVGASGGIFGLLLAFGLAFPHRKLILLFPPIPMPAWLFVTLYGVVELFLGVTGREASVAHFAHLGGMIGGFALILYWRARHPSRH